MRIIIKGTNFKLTPSIRQYVEEKIGGLNKFLKRIDPETIEAKVEVGKITRGQRHGDIFKAEVNLDINGHFIRAEQTEESLQAAIDLVKDELAEEIKHHKEKSKTQYIRGARSWKKLWQLNRLSRFRYPKIKNIFKKKK